MQFLSDILLAFASVGAASYCIILSRRLRALGSLEGGMGSAIAVLSRQVDELTRSLNAAQNAVGSSQATLAAQTERAEAAARKLEMLVASLHDLPSDHSEAPLETQRAPTPWPGDTWKRQPDVQQEQSAAQKTRLLRRRQGQGAF